ncbi:right-handed parallel beta-helix repeat-containing protein [Rosettibacter firmus]|uniref:right-handed parallel beta-helix repeat-containing protein n=1 Tax=Rosettibacter firmus TaxID=3111522 RepID=UPI00336BD74A
MSSFNKILKSTFIFVFICLININAQYYVALNGDDNNPGTISQPFKTITKAISVAQPGDTIYVRGGNYKLTSTISIGSSKSGTESKRYYLFAYPGERPVLDFSSMSVSSSNRGISLRANYWYVKGIDIKGAGDNGMEISGGSYNIIENCSFYENRDSGLQLSNGASNNKIINCDSYYNADPGEGNADGFAPKLTVGSNNYFYGCRAWQNSDDGWDGYLRGADNVTTILENCWTFLNGYRKDGTIGSGNGNGFKMGGGDNSNSLNLMHHFILKNCLAFNNKVKGFDQNNNAGSMTLLNCTGYGNKSANYRITRQINAGQQLIVKNCISLNGSVELGSFAIQEKNSWLSPFKISEADFISLDASPATAPRKPDGSLPDIDFLHLNSNSQFIDAGVDVGLQYYGNAPDLGAFEWQPLSNISESNQTIEKEFYLYQNFPNPFNPSTTITFYLSSSSNVKIDVYNILGEKVASLIDSFYDAGQYSITWNADESLQSGVYFIKMNSYNSSKIVKALFLK